MPFRLFAFWRKKPVLRMMLSSAGSGAFAIACGVGYRRNSSGVTMLTRSSVHCADRIVAHTSWNGVSRSSSQSTSGYSSSRPVDDRTDARRIGRPRQPAQGPAGRLGDDLRLVTIFRTIFRMSLATRGGYNIRRPRWTRRRKRWSRFAARPSRSTSTSTGVRFRFLAAIALGAVMAGLVALIMWMVDSKRNPCERVRDHFCKQDPPASRVRATRASSTSRCTTRAPRCAPTSRRSACRRSSASKKKTTSRQVARPTRPLRRASAKILPGLSRFFGSHSRFSRFCQSITSGDCSHAM